MTPTPTRLLVVIVCYRAAELTINCLRSLRPEVRANPGTRVAVCENGTGADSAAMLADTIRAEGWSDWVSLKVIHPNRGFAGGNNVILREALAWDPPPEYFLLLNADTIVRAGALRSMLDALQERPDVGIVGPRLEEMNGRAQVSCFRDLSPISELLRGAQTGPLTRLLRNHDVPIPPSHASHEPDWICFACALFRRAVLEQVGLLDAGFYLYFDDPDYCLRARRAGWRVLHCPSARVVHLVGQSNPVERNAAEHLRRPRYYYASRTRYFAKSYGHGGLLLANLLWSAGRALSLMREWAANKPRHTCDREWRDIWTNALRPLSTENDHGQSRKTRDVDRIPRSLIQAD